MVFSKPKDIENESMRIISEELLERGVELDGDELTIVRRVIHTTADFDFAESMVFSRGWRERIRYAFDQKSSIICDTNMTLAGINKNALRKLSCEAYCYVADEDVRILAEREQTTRAANAVRKAARSNPGCIYAVGNAPTALFELAAQIKNGFLPTFVIAVPVGFVNVEESKKAIAAVCREHDIACIVSMGRKGGSTVSCAIINALLYMMLQGSKGSDQCFA